MKFDITRQPLIPSFLTLAALVVVTLVTADPNVTPPATASEEAALVEGVAIRLPRLLLVDAQEAWPTGTKLLAGLLLLVAGMVTGRMTIRYNLYSAATCLAIPLFGIVACGLGTRGEYLAAAAAAALLALAVKNFGRSFCNGYGFDATFRAAFYLGLLPLIAPAATPLLLMLPVALVLFRRTLREAAVALAGVVLPHAALCYLNWGAGGTLAAPLESLGRLLVAGKPLDLLLSLPLPQQIALGVTALLCIAALLLFLTDIYSVGTRPRFLLVFTICTFLVTLLALCAPAATRDDLLLMAVPAAVLLPVLFVRTRRAIALPLYLLLIAGAAAAAFLQ